jgi:3alpha(or 20beta)-hydroxysteroid dehydrogenase
MNPIHPGIVDIPMIEVWINENFQTCLANVPLYGADNIGNVAKLVQFLLSDESKHITGAEFAINGRLSLEKCAHVG